MSYLLLEVFRNKLSSIAEEMGIALQRTAFSPNIKERKDLSCAIFDSKGRLIAQAEHIPVHLGSMASAVRQAISSCEIQEGDMLILNDPYRGGTHLPDITLVAPVFHRGKLMFYVANRAHHSDIGGMSSGSMPLSRTLYQEGLVIPPLKIVERGELKEELLSIILANTRTPEERMGDLSAQITANRIGIDRVTSLIDEVGAEVNLLCDQLLQYSERLMRSFLSSIPEGTYEFEDFIEDDGLGRENIAIRVRLHIGNGKVEVDFSESDPQVDGPVNAVRSITIASTYYVFRSFLEEDAPTNEGVFKPTEVITKRGTVVDATPPCAVAGGNVETSQRVVDVVLGALSEALPNYIPSASQGTMNNLTIGGIDPESGESFTYYETIGGGMGAWAGGDGESAVHSHMTNTMNTPIEALEHTFPFLVREYSVRRGSGGEGLRKGGDGIVRKIEFLTDVEVTLLSERRKIPPYGLFGGKPGKVGRNIVVKGGKKTIMEGKFSTILRRGDVLRIETPGGGGYA